MKKTRKFFMIILAAALLATSASPISVMATTNGKTRADAVNWACARGNERWKVDVDGVYGCQCVDLILAYYDYLLGWHTSGNAKDYAWNNLPGGWTRQYGNPQPGDIVVWGAGASLGSGVKANGTYGHIGIIWQVNASGTISTIETNVGNVQNAGYFERITGGVACYIRPDFYSGHTHSYSSSITKQPTCTQQGVKTFRCSCGASYTEAVSAKGHQYVNKTVAPTLTEKGYTSHTCSACKNSYNDNYVDPPKKNEDGWYYSTSVPQGVTAENYQIQYQNYYEKIQKDSPGNDWKNAGTAKDEWQNSGGTYTSATDLPTSDARVLVGSEYYHFCGPNAGNEGNYDQTGKFVHYDGVSANRVTARYLGTDNGHPYYFIYWKDSGAQISCQSGITCDGSYGNHGNRCRAWYKMNTYQDRVRVVQYKFTKTSDWSNTKDAAASSLKVRFKELKAAEPAPTPEPTPEPTPAPEPMPNPDPTPAPAPTPNPDPEPTPNPDPAPAPDLTPEPEPTPEPAPIPAPDPTPLAVGEKITDAKSGGNYKVTGASVSNPTAAYIGTVNKNAKSVVIPDSIVYNGIRYKVTEIGAKALRNHKKVTTVRAGEQVTKIGDGAFENCTKLKSVTVGKRLKSIGKNAWKGCKSLKTVTIQSKVLKSAGSKAFGGIHKKARIVVPKAKLSAYKKLLKNKGQAKSVKIVR